MGKNKDNTQRANAGAIAIPLTGIGAELLQGIGSATVPVPTVVPPLAVALSGPMLGAYELATGQHHQIYTTPQWSQNRVYKADATGYVSKGAGSDYQNALFRKAHLTNPQPKPEGENSDDQENKPKKPFKQKAEQKAKEVMNKLKGLKQKYPKTNKVLKTVGIWQGVGAAGDMASNIIGHWGEPFQFPLTKNATPVGWLVKGAEALREPTETSTQHKASTPQQRQDYYWKQYENY